MAEGEHDLIRQRYQRRRSLANDRYSLFNPGNLFNAQRLERTLLQALARHGIRSLAERRILEVGCGNGYWLRELLKYGAAPSLLQGIDLLPERVAQAAVLSPNINIELGNAERLPYSDRSFDIVLQSTMFTSVLDPGMRAAIAREMLRVLMPAGLIVWYDFRYDNPANPDVRGIPIAQVRRLFPGCAVDHRLTTLAPLLARRLGTVSLPLCAMLSLLPPLLSHYLAIITKRPHREPA